jgi:hypothetical protein
MFAEGHHIYMRTQELFYSAGMGNCMEEGVTIKTGVDIYC